MLYSADVYRRRPVPRHEDGYGENAARAGWALLDTGAVGAAGVVAISRCRCLDSGRDTVVAVVVCVGESSGLVTVGLAIFFRSRYLDVLLTGR